MLRSSEVRKEAWNRSDSSFPSDFHPQLDLDVWIPKLGENNFLLFKAETKRIGIVKNKTKQTPTEDYARINTFYRYQILAPNKHV